ncbi:MAG TPA: hypothetical protein VN222_11410 [Novosphingobium sp.]|nr:hypothetical protein [Novosphingobium sp.]
MNENFPKTLPLSRAQRGSGRLWVWTILVLAVAALGLTGWVMRGAIAAHVERALGLMPVPSAPAAPTGDPVALSHAQAGLEARLATLEQRLLRTDMAAATAADNAGRAEALLIAFSARRQLDRGAPLGYLETALTQRFGDAQPLAVAAVINAGRQPVTRDRLAARLDQLAPLLTDKAGGDGAWGRIGRDLAGMFVLHKDGATASPDPNMRLQHARMCLSEGRVEDAIADVRLMPGAKAGEQWIADAHRYGEAQHALDIIETAALLPAIEAPRPTAAAAPAVPAPAPSPAPSPAR